MSTTKKIKIVLTKAGTAYDETKEYHLHDYIIIDNSVMYICRRVDATTMVCVGHPLTDEQWWDKSIDLSGVEGDVTKAVEQEFAVYDLISEHSPVTGPYTNIPEKYRETGTKMKVEVVMSSASNMGIGQNTSGSAKDTLTPYIRNSTRAQAGTYTYEFELQENATCIRVCNFTTGVATGVASVKIYAQNSLVNRVQSNTDSIDNIKTEVAELASYHNDAAKVKAMADKYDYTIAKREQYLRNKYKYDGIGRWYGVTWVESDDAHNVTDIYADGCSASCDELPIQNKMRRCIVKGGAVQYYLDADNSLLKEDGTDAVLDGTDGNVMVEIPEFFYKMERELNDDGYNVVRLKISEDGIDGFNYSPKHYVGAYFATLNRDENTLASVCSALFSVTTEALSISAEGNYVEGEGYSLGSQLLAVRTGFAANAKKYRGGNQSASQTVFDPNDQSKEVTCDYWDDCTDVTANTFCLNKLGVGIAQVKRSECREEAKMAEGECMYLYDTHKALWILSTVEFKTRNIQDAINTASPREGGLGKGATQYPSYSAYEAFFAYRGTACIPNGVTNCLGNKSGEVYYRMYQCPLDGSLSDKTFTSFANILMPVMSYRGVENYYGHLYSTADQITVHVDKTDTANVNRVKYYYQRNPFKCKTDITNYEYLGEFEFKSSIQPIGNIVKGFDAHILPCGTVSSYTKGYCDCTEIGGMDGNLGISYNGRLASGTLPGRNFIVAMFPDDTRANRASESTRLCAFIL